MSLRCRIGIHKFRGDGEYVRDDSIARVSNDPDSPIQISLIEAGYYRYYCERCNKASDADRKSNVS